MPNFNYSAAYFKGIKIWILSYFLPCKIMLLHNMSTNGNFVDVNFIKTGFHPYCHPNN